MNSTFQWESIRCGGLGGMQVPGGGGQGAVGPQGIQPESGGLTRAGWCGASPQEGAGAAPLCIPIPWGLGCRGGYWRIGWMQPWDVNAERDHLGVEMHPLSKAGRAGAGREVGKGLAAAS